MITISHLTKIFEGKGPRVTALEDVNLEIGKGDIYGIIGMSGAGKSTLLRCLTLLERDRKSTRLNSSHITRSRMPSSA